MFKSKVDKFNIVDVTLYRRDPLKELAKACQRAGIRFGFYYSQYQDWREQGLAAVAWDYPQQTHSFDRYLERKALPQVRELLRNYGPISVVWFDTPGTMGEKYSRQLVDLVKKYQPQALINSRIGNGVGDYSTYGDNEVPRVSPSGVWEASIPHVLLADRQSASLSYLLIKFHIRNEFSNFRGKSILLHSFTPYFPRANEKNCHKMRVVSH